MPNSPPAPGDNGASSAEALHNLIMQSLDDDQAVEVVSIPLAGKSNIADYMVIASGRSTRRAEPMAGKSKADLGKPGKGEAIQAHVLIVLAVGQYLLNTQHLHAAGAGIATDLSTGLCAAGAGVAAALRQARGGAEGEGGGNGSSQDERFFLVHDETPVDAVMIRWCQRRPWRAVAWDDHCAVTVRALHQANLKAI